MVGAFRAWRLRSAARRYATELGPRLRADYGASAHYTMQQIQSAALRAKLPAEHIRFGYAGFMTEEAFRALDPVSDYRELRAMLRRGANGRPVSAGLDPAPENSDARAAAIDVSNPSGF